MFVNAEGDREIAKDNRRKGAMRCVHQVHIVRGVHVTKKK